MDIQPSGDAQRQGHDVDLLKSAQVVRLANKVEAEYYDLISKPEATLGGFGFMSIINAYSPSFNSSARRIDISAERT